MAGLLHLSERINSEQDLQRILGKWTGKKSITYQTQGLFTQPRIHGYGASVYYKTYTRGKHTLIFKVEVIGANKVVELLDVLPKVKRKGGASYQALEKLMPILDRTCQIYGWHGILATLARPLANHELLELAEQGLQSYEETYLRVHF